MVLSKRCPDGRPRSPGVPQTQDQRITTMTVSRLAAFLDRLAPVAILAMGLMTAFATATLGA